MEYQFIRDPITGFRMLISDEHSNIARWFNEQLNPQYDEVKKFYMELLESISANKSYVMQGAELTIYVSDGEIAINTNNVAIEINEQERLEQEGLDYQTTYDSCECGADDFLEITESWLEFLK